MLKIAEEALVIDFTTLASGLGILVIFAVLVGFAIYGFIVWKSKKQYEIAYVDKYKQLIKVSKLNCPPEIYGKKLIGSPDKHFDGRKIGYIYGKNFIQSTKGKWYHAFIITKQKKQLINPLSWGEADMIALAEQDKISIGNGFNVNWNVGGLDYEGYFIMEAGGELTPTDVYLKTKDMVGLKQANIGLKNISKMVEEAADGNPNVKIAQKMGSELPSRER